MNIKKFKKPPINITQVPPEISSELFVYGIGELTGTRGFVNSKTLEVLKSAGLGKYAYDIRSSTGGIGVRRDQFLKAVKALENAGIIPHRSGQAADMYKKLGSIESWQQYRSFNIKRRMKEYAVEERTEGDRESRAEEVRDIPRRIVGVGIVNRNTKLFAEAIARKEKRAVLSRARTNTKNTQVSYWSEPLKAGWKGSGGSGWTKNNPGSSWSKRTPRNTRKG